MNKFWKKLQNNNMNKNKIFLKMAIGFIAGIISGLFSTGGGMILVPAFIYLLKIKSSQTI